jgi:hypothetical protein
VAESSSTHFHGDALWGLKNEPEIQKTEKFHGYVKKNRFIQWRLKPFSDKLAYPNVIVLKRE